MTWFNKTTKTYSGETDLDQGTDGSSEYLKSRKIRLIIGHHNTGATVSFKPFLTGYSMALSSKQIDKTNEYLRLTKQNIFATDSLGIDVTFSLDLLAHSVNEAKVNMMRMNELEHMHKSVVPNDENGNFYLMNIYYVSFANILTAKYTSKQTISNMTQLKQIGVPCFMEGFTFSIDKEMGMFEHNGSLYPKKYSLELKFKISNAAYKEAQASDQAEYLWLPLLEEINSHYDEDIKTFPFGITGPKGRRGTDGADEWSSNHGAHIYIGGTSNRFFQKFKPYLDSFSWTYTHSNLKIEEEKFVGGGLRYQGGGGETLLEHKVSFSVLSHSVNEAINNMWKLQMLIRLADQFYPQYLSDGELEWSNDYPDAPTIYFKFNDINSSQKNSTINSWDDLYLASKKYYMKGISFNFDISMGMFEHKGMLYFKKYDVSLDLKRVGAGTGKWRTETSWYGKDKPELKQGKKHKNYHHAIDHHIFK